jgi:hypothetical protein
LKAQIWLDITNESSSILKELREKLPQVIWNMPDHHHFVTIESNRIYLVLNSNVTAHNIDSNGIKMIIDPKENLPDNDDFTRYHGMKLFIEILMSRNIYSCAVLKDLDDNVLFKTTKNNFTDDCATIIGGIDI